MPANAGFDVLINEGRIYKIGSAGGLLAAGAWLIQQSRVTTDNAVVSAYVRSIRSPIEGQVSGLHLHVGDGVTGTSLLVHVLNDRVNDEHLVAAPHPSRQPARRWETACIPLPPCHPSTRGVSTMGRAA